MTTSIQSRLIALGHAKTETEAQAQYERLFLEVFKMLSRRGLKELNRETLQNCLALRSLSADDRALSEVIDRIVNVDLPDIHRKLVEHDRKLERLEQSDVGGIAGVASRAVSELLVRDGEQRYRELSDLLDHWELPAAYASAEALSEWLLRHENELPRVFLGNIFALLAETEIAKAKAAGANGSTSDFSKARVFLNRATEIAP